MQKELEAKGEDPMLLFIQLDSFDASGDFVESKMDGSSVPVLQDTTEIDIWGKYNSLWPEFDTMYYHIVIINASGCIAAHFGPVSEPDLEGPGSLPLKQAWEEALHAECSTYQVEQEDVVEAVEVALEPVADLVEQPDVTEDTGLPDLPDYVEEPDDVQVADETSVDIIDEEISVEPDTEIFQLQELCQIVAGEALQPGQQVPHFLCQDMNPNSPGFGNAVSDQTLKGVVWLAYYGSCT